ncbi:MAG TPA: glycosyltransferase [Candidatus Paceibacterota bacterium]|nr:glycosyltransferase [Candidatus Paceibacterota bacterium]
MARVFIGMPVYNGQRFLKKAIESFRSQSFRDWTMLISDDCSSDATAQIAAGYAAIDSRIAYIRQDKNLGLFENFHATLDEAVAPYFMWAAQDDIREPEYLKTCVERLDADTSLGLATTQLAVIDSFDRPLTEETQLSRLSGGPGFMSIARYVAQPEVLGKCNLMYGLFRTEAARAAWRAYPQRRAWGQDYLFSLALISRYPIFIDPRIMFKKRRGGFSDAGGTDNDRSDTASRISYKNPKNHMFPFGRFGQYFKGHMEALKGTPYRPLAATILLARLPRALCIHIKERLAPSRP